MSLSKKTCTSYHKIFLNIILGDYKGADMQE